MEDTNKVGYFNNEMREYLIQDMYPSRNWENFLFNDTILCEIDQFGQGGSWHRDEHGVRSELCSGKRLIYLRDNETNHYWCANRNFLKESFDTFNTRVGLGYSIITSEHLGIRCEFRLAVPTQGNKELWTITITNCGNETRDISVFVSASINVNSTGHTAYNQGRFLDGQDSLLFSHHGFGLTTQYPHACFTSDTQADAWDTTDRHFTGVYGSKAHPDSLMNSTLSCTNTSFDDEMSATFQYKLHLSPQGDRTIQHTLSLLKHESDSTSEKDMCTTSSITTELNKVQKENAKFIKNTWIETPDNEINSLANIWFKRQMALGKTWGRVYTKGFRDIMQDTTGLMALDPQLGREKIIYCLHRQWSDGNTLRQWEPELRHPYRDGAAWIVPAVNCYIKETGDYSLLDELVPYFESDEQGTVLDHCKRGMNFLMDNLGENGMCLWGGGDWNDSLEAAGLQGKGESVWLTQATIASNNEFIALLTTAGYNDLAQLYNKKGNTLTDSLLKNGWEDDHFLCGINDWGEKIGSYSNEEGQFFLNMQSWAVLADVIKGDDAIALMELSEEKLGCPFGYVLNTPSYSVGDPHIGRVTYMEKGAYENGSVYNHGVAFKIAADCRLGRGNAALDTLKKILMENPDNPANVSGCEPYAITNMYLGPENGVRVGKSMHGWITGTAGWLFRDIMEYMLGIQADYSGLAIRPCLPSSWDKSTIKRVFRRATYNITLLNPMGLETGSVRLTLNGEVIKGDIIPIQAEGEHEVVALLNPLPIDANCTEQLIQPKTKATTKKALV